MARLASYQNLYVPKETYFRDAKGTLKKNSELSIDERVEIEMTYATIDQKNAYMQFYSETGKGKEAAIKMFQSYHVDQALKKHIQKVKNLEDENGKAITDGADLVMCKHPELNDFKQDLFFRICGIRLDEDAVDDDKQGELTLGESKASD